MCKNNYLNPLRFSLARETDTVKSSAIGALQFSKIGVLVNYIIKDYKFCKVAQLFLWSVSLATVNLSGLREFYRKIQPTDKETNGSIYSYCDPALG